MTDKDPCAWDYARSAAIIKAGVNKRASAIQAGLNHWIAEHVHPADGAALGVALMRMAVNEHIRDHGRADTIERFTSIIDEKPTLDG